MSKQTAENVILSQTLVKNHAQIQLLPFDSYYAIFHLCEFSLVPKWAYLEDPLYNEIFFSIGYFTFLNSYCSKNS